MGHGGIPMREKKVVEQARMQVVPLRGLPMRSETSFSHHHGMRRADQVGGAMQLCASCALLAASGDAFDTTRRPQAARLWMIALTEAVR
jgi:hypothetical protein